MEEKPVAPTGTEAIALIREYRALHMADSGSSQGQFLAKARPVAPVWCFAENYRYEEVG